MQKKKKKWCCILTHTRNSARRAAFPPNGRNKKIPLEPHLLDGVGIFSPGCDPGLATLVEAEPIRLSSTTGGAPLAPEWWGSVGAQHATPCAVRRIMNRCKKKKKKWCCILTHTCNSARRAAFPPNGRNKKKYRLNPTYWMGWVFLAQGATLG